MVGTLLGTLVPLLPPFLPAISIFLVIFRRWTLFILSAAATVFVSPAYLRPQQAWETAYFLANEAWGRFVHHQWTLLWFASRGAVLSAAAGATIALLLDPPQRLKFDFDETFGSNLFLRFLPRLVYAGAVASVCATALFFVQTVYKIPFDVNNLSEIARRPWVPAEKINLKTGEVKVGYTLSTANRWQIVLNDYDRTINFIRADQVIARTVCRPSLQNSDLPGVEVAPIMPPLPLIQFPNVHIVQLPAC